jgi:hypothetical protein
LLLTTSPTFARTWHITPDGTGDAPTIQAGIDSAAVGDTVEVACGTYYEHDIELAGGVHVVAASPGDGCAIVDAQSLGRGIVGQHLSLPAAVVGLTITNGRVEGTLIEDAAGGGILVVNSDVTLDSVTLQSNMASFGGGAAFLESTFLVRDCEVVENYTPTGGGMRWGGGIFCNDSDGTLAHTAFVGNSSRSEGGGLDANDSVVLVTECRFEGNTSLKGGGIGVYGGSGDVTVQSCLLVGNSTVSQGGSIYVAYSSLVVTNSTIVLSESYESDVYSYYASPVLDGCLLAFGPQLPVLCAYPPAPVQVSCTNVYGYPGGNWGDCLSGQLGQSGHICAAPLFCDLDGDDFHLAANSPCLPGNHPDGWSCGLIGALGQGCGPVGVDASTWARIKARYR